MKAEMPIRWGIPANMGADKPLRWGILKKQDIGKLKVRDQRSPCNDAHFAGNGLEIHSGELLYEKIAFDLGYEHEGRVVSKKRFSDGQINVFLWERTPEGIAAIVQSDQWLPVRRYEQLVSLARASARKVVAAEFLEAEADSEMPEDVFWLVW